jgi:hypothetical protein
MRRAHGVVAGCGVSPGDTPVMVRGARHRVGDHGGSYRTLITEAAGPRVRILAHPVPDRPRPAASEGTDDVPDSLLEAALSDPRARRGVRRF